VRSSKVGFLNVCIWKVFGELVWRLIDIGCCVGFADQGACYRGGL
jgi:hypothetical protein